MPSIKEPGPRSVDGPITFADVLAQIPVTAEGKITPNEVGVNASSIRAAIGRGSNQTVQRHLDAIRSELIASMQSPPASTTPSPPADAVSAIWAAAWSAAQVSTLARLDHVTAERDALAQRASVQTADLDALAAEADRLRDQAVVAVADRDAAQAALQAREAELAGQLAAESKVRADVESLLVRERESASHAAEIASKEWEIERRTMQAQLDRLQERVSELRALEIWAASQARPSDPK